jgi:hypothetical protein
MVYKAGSGGVNYCDCIGGRERRDLEKKKRRMETATHTAGILSLSCLRVFGLKKKSNRV